MGLLFVKKIYWNEEQQFSRGSLFFAYFLLSKQKKVSRSTSEIRYNYQRKKSSAQISKNDRTKVRCSVSKKSSTEVYATPPTIN